MLVNFTAAWCVTCQVNEKVALGAGEVSEAFRRTGATYLRADWTKQDASITRLLQANGRAGVPMYLVYMRSGSTGEKTPPMVLPQILTAETVLDAIREPGDRPRK